MSETTKFRLLAFDRIFLIRLQIILLWLLIPLAVFGQTSMPTFKTGAEPDWVKPVAEEPVQTIAIADQNSFGQAINLIDTQINVAEAETFVRVVKEITTEAGIQNGANLQFSWDPSFQELIIHEITIQRGMERMNRLDASKFKIIQQETDLTRQIYNGTLSAVLFLDDVRVGDRIEYSYTLRGRNPSEKGRYSDSFILGSSMPIKHRQIRLLWPEGRHLNFKVHGVNVEPKIHAESGSVEYIWELRDVPSVIIEDRLPSWFQPYPWLQLSEYANWSEVATWATGLYVSTNLDAPDLKRAIAGLRNPGATAEQNIQNALGFVQNSIRYLGIEFGPNSYHPTDPMTVLTRRFGDCKDKAFLLCTFLHGLGYEAAPVLVATGFRQTLPDLLPSPYDFDHVIVRVVADGQTYWLDPTRSFQRDPIANRFLPDYSFGLLVRAGETNLISIPFSGSTGPETTTTENFRVGGQKEPAQLSVTITYTGSDAEWMRAVLASEGRETMAKDYLNDYGQRYPGVRAAAPMVIEDSTNCDALTFIHSYIISNFWVLNKDKQLYNCQFYPLGIHSWLIKPTTAVRSMPMEISFPRQRTVRTVIELPRKFKLSNLTNTIVGPASQLRVQRTFRGQTVWLDYEYQALTNFIPMSLTDDYLKSLDQMESALGYSLNWQSVDGVGKTSQFNWPVFWVASIYTTVLTIGLGFLCRHQLRTLSRSELPPFLDPKLNGLGGWLVLVGLGLVFSPCVLLFNLDHSIGSFSLWKWHALTNPDGVSYQPIWGPLLTLEFLGQITILTLDIFAIVLFFQKRRIFPRWFIALLAVNALFVVADAIGAQFMKTVSPALTASLSRNIMRSFIGCCIWIPYMLKSLRVKTTFIR